MHRVICTLYVVYTVVYMYTCMYECFVFVFRAIFTLFTSLFECKIEVDCVSTVFMYSVPCTLQGSLKVNSYMTGSLCLLLYNNNYYMYFHVTKY